MLNELALMSLLMLAPSQATELSLENVRSTVGHFGHPRMRAPLKPGDTLFLSFDITGLSNDGTGKVAYSMGMELATEKGVKLFEQKPVDSVDQLPLGGSVLPARAFVLIPLEQDPGNYVVRLTVVDKATKVSKTLEEKYTVKPREFGIVTLFSSYDPKGEIPAPLGGQAGQRIWVQFAVVEFTRSPTTKQPNLEVSMEAFTATGEAVTKPTVVTYSMGIDEKDTGIPMLFMLPLNREGKFKVKLKVTDKLTNKVDAIELPITVHPAS